MYHSRRGCEAFVILSLREAVWTVGVSGDLARAFRMLRRPTTAPFVLRSAAEIEMADRPATWNSSSRRSSSWVQILYLFPTMLGRTGNSGCRSEMADTGNTQAASTRRTPMAERAHSVFFLWWRCWERQESHRLNSCGLLATYSAQSRRIILSTSSALKPLPLGPLLPS